MARTEIHRGYRFDIGGHRFLTAIDSVRRFWEETLGQDLLQCSRRSRIYYEGKFFDYPLRLDNVARNLGLVESARCLASYVGARLAPRRDETNFEQWVSNRFGRRLYERFFKTYTEKIWGMPCAEINSEWAAQRIRGLSLPVALRYALARRGRATVKTLATQFAYPRLGCGMMWERTAERLVSAGHKVLTHRKAVRIEHDGRRVRSVVAAGEEGEETIETFHLISSIPLRDLVGCLRPAPENEVLSAAARLRYRDLMTVGLIVSRGEIFPDQWIYVHSPSVSVGRVQNFKNWSRDMVPDHARTCLGLEYFCNAGDRLWKTDDKDLVRFAAGEMEQLGLFRSAEVEDGVVFRQRDAYPVYSGDYRVCVQTVRRFLRTLENLQTIGRNGLHRYDNQDQAMMTGILAARNVLGDRCDVWDWNARGSPDHVD